MFSLKRNNLFYFIIFVFFVSLVFIVFKDLFNSYFEADEWFHFTNYLPLTSQPYGFLSIIFRTITDTGLLSRGQHLVPIGEEIFFLNSLFFGTNYVPYAFLTLLLHSINSFLVYMFIKALLKKGKNIKKSILYALMGGIFFALAQIHFHAVVWAAFYGQNNLSVTFFLFCILFFKMAFNTEKKLFLYLTVFFLFLDLFTKETATALFFVLPFMAIIEKRVFLLKYLAKLFMFSLIIFTIFRFVIPNVYFGVGEFANRWADNYVTSANKTTGNKDTGTIVSTDLSIYNNIYAELLSRSVRFPVKMTSEFYFSRDTILSFMRIISPIVYPLPDNVSGTEEAGKSQNYQFFLNGPGNELIIYMLSISIILFILLSARKFYISKKIAESKAIITGLAIIFFSALPLVLIVLSFPRWGYDTYLDSRHYYMGSVGAAIIFPFLLFGIGNYISKLIPHFLRFKTLPFIVVFLLFCAWFINNMYVLDSNLSSVIDDGSFPRREIITQLKKSIPTLPQKAVFFAQTDGLGAYGNVLPFLTSFPQVLTVVYYDKNHLPDSFFNKFVLDAKPQGYSYSEGRGFGFYNTKKTLSEALLTNSFSVKDVYAFYYNSKATKLDDITKSIRAEMDDYLKDSKDTKDWLTFQDSVTKVSFRYPEDTKVEEEIDAARDLKVLREYKITGPKLTVQLSVISITPTFDINEIKTVVSEKSDKVVSTRIYFDKYHYNDAFVIINNSQTQYFVKFTDKLVKLVIFTNGDSQYPVFEKIMGSLVISE